MIDLPPPQLINSVNINSVNDDYLQEINSRLRLNPVARTISENMQELMSHNLPRLLAGQDIDETSAKQAGRLAMLAAQGGCFTLSCQTLVSHPYIAAMLIHSPDIDSSPADWSQLLGISVVLLSPDNTSMSSRIEETSLLISKCTHRRWKNAIKLMPLALCKGSPTPEIEVKELLGACIELAHLRGIEGDFPSIPRELYRLEMWKVQLDVLEQEHQRIVQSAHPSHPWQQRMSKIKDILYNLKPA